MFFSKVLIDYVIPIIYTSFASLVLVLFFLFVFRIKDSNIRILFFFIPLIKPFIIVAEKINNARQYLQSRTFAGLLRLPDPNNMVREFDIFKKSPHLISEINYLILSSVSIIIIFVLIARWINILIFYRELSYEEMVFRKDVPEIYNIMDSYTGKINIKIPAVSLTHRDYPSPFVAGIKNYTVFLSPNLMERLTLNEKEVLLQHELSHIKRKDNITGWIALILRDLLFFNPFAYIAYQLIRCEQEKDSDKLVVRYSGKSKKEISKSILNIILKMKFSPASKHASGRTSKSSISPFNLFDRIKLRNRINSISRTDPDKIYSRMLPRILMCACFVLILLFQIIFIFKINDQIILLR